MSFEEAAKQITRQKLPTAILTGEKMIDINKLLGRQKEDLILSAEQLQRNILDPTKLKEGMIELQQQGIKQIQELKQRQIPAQQIITPTVTQPMPEE